MHHPDNYAQNPIEQEKHAQISSKLNRDYQLLLDDLSRAQTILGIRGVSVSDLPKPDFEFLGFVLELSQEIQDSDDTRALALKQEHDDRTCKTRQELAVAFEKEDYEAAKSKTVELSYWKRIQRLLEKRLG